MGVHVCGSCPTLIRLSFFLLRKRECAPAVNSCRRWHDLTVTTTLVSYACRKSCRSRCSTVWLQVAPQRRRPTPVRTLGDEAAARWLPMAVTLPTMSWQCARPRLCRPQAAPHCALRVSTTPLRSQRP